MKTKVNEVPLVGPRGRKELLKRINELEAWVAQQDYLVVEIADIENPTREEKKKLNDFYLRGVLFNVIIKVGEMDCRVLSYEGDNESFDELTTIYGGEFIYITG